MLTRILISAILLTACGGDAGTDDAGADAGPGMDATVDAGPSDAGADDAGADDDAGVDDDAGAEPDSGVMADAGPEDAGPGDAGLADAGMVCTVGDACGDTSGDGGGSPPNGGERPAPLLLGSAYLGGGGGPPAGTGLPPAIGVEWCDGCPEFGAFAGCPATPGDAFCADFLPECGGFAMTPCSGGRECLRPDGSSVGYCATPAERSCICTRVAARGGRVDGC